MKILYVEDNNRTLLKNRLRRAGFTVLVAPDATQGIAIATSEQPDLIFMDLRLPDIDGWEAARRLKAGPTTKHIPVVALTANAMEGDREKALAAGCDDFDTKPVKLPRLLGKLRALAPTGTAPSFALRLRLRGCDFGFGNTPETATAFTKCIDKMSRILVKRGIEVAAADRAILKTMQAAIDFPLADLRRRAVQRLDAQSNHALDLLIKTLTKIRDVIAKFPPSSKGKLNSHFSSMFHGAIFDTDVFLDVLEGIVAFLPNIAPRRRAEEVVSIIYPDGRKGVRPRIVDQWESVPAKTRVAVEKALGRAGQPKSLLQWLNHLIILLDRERPAPKGGAPLSTTRLFVSRVARIWGELGLRVGHAYRGDVGRRIESGFQSYCNAALKAIDDSTTISARQLTNYKKMQKPYTP